MIRWMSITAALCLTVGCSDVMSDSAPLTPPAPDAFAGAWRSVTPSLEFIRLTVASKSSEQGVLAARLTFSGVAWEGSGRITGDSVVAGMMMAGTTTSSGVIVARVPDARTLRVQVRPTAAPAIDLTFIRED